MPLSRRLFLYFGLLWAGLWILGIGAAYLTVTRGMTERARAVLLEDTARVARFYRQGEVGEVTATGGVEIALFDYEGRPLWPEDPGFRLPPAALDTGEAPRIFALPDRLAAVADAGVGLIALSQETGFIRDLAAATARNLALLFALGLLLGGLATGVLARRIAAPFSAAARAVATRGPENLAPIPYAGPDDELGQLITRFNALLAELKAARAAERDFLNEIAHEINTPLAVLEGQLATGEVEAARATARQLARQVADLLALARGETARSLDLHLVRVDRLIMEVARAFPGVEVEAAPPLEVLGDPDRLRQLLFNLVQNAVRAAGAKGVRLGARAEAKGVLIYVEDDGPGIPKELLPRLFERYVKGAGGRQGLGLAIAKQIAEAHGGEIRVRSEPGKTRFEVRLPGLEEE